MRGQENRIHAIVAVHEKSAIPMRGQEESRQRVVRGVLSVSHPHEGSGERQDAADLAFRHPGSAIPMRGQEARIIKLWRNQKTLDFSSFYLELTVINALAYSRASLSGTLAAKAGSDMHVRRFL